MIAGGPQAMQDDFTYDDETVGVLKSSISESRLSTYLKLANGDYGSALKLYAHNMALSEAFLGPLHCLEVVLRNRIDVRLCADYGPQWYSLRIFQKRETTFIEKTIGKLKKRDPQLKPDKVISELPFGFWVGVFGRRYEDPLWRKTLRQMFANAEVLRRKHVVSALEPLRTLRNRIAHHEPILKRGSDEAWRPEWQSPDDLLVHFENILIILRWIDPKLSRWVLANSRVLNALEHFGTTNPRIQQWDYAESRILKIIESRRRKRPN